MIQHIASIYGIPLCSNAAFAQSSPVPQIIHDALVEAENNGYEGILKAFYNGALEFDPEYCGVIMNEHAFDLGEHTWRNIQDINPTPTQEVIQKFNDQFRELDPKLREAILAYGGEPRVFLIQHSS